MNKFPRFFIHHDGSFLHYVQPPIGPERFVHETVGCVADTQVDGIICHMFTFGDAVPLYPTSIPAARAVFPEKAESVNMWKNIRNMKTLAVMRRDPWVAAIEAAHKQGKPFWGAMRFNDGHPPSYGVNSQFIVTHPEYRLGKRCGAPWHEPDPDGTIPECPHLDFSIREVREHRLALVEEVCTRYNIDGFEWDFTRDARHNFPGNVPEKGRVVLTDYLQETQQLLIRVGEKRGRLVGFAARVPGTPEVCRETGYDIEQWIKLDIFNMITPTVHYDTTAELPFDKFVRMAKGKKCRIYASVTEAVGPGRFRPSPIEAVRGAALVAWRQGIDGINLFNFHCYPVYNRSDNECLLSELGSIATLERKNKLYMLAGIAVPSQSRFFGIKYHSAHRHQLPVDVPEQPQGPGVTVNFEVGDDIVLAREERTLSSVLLKLDLCHFTGDEELEMTLNGLAIPASHAHLAPSKQYPWNYTGMHGHLELTYDLTNGDWVHQGKNEFSMLLRQRPADIRPNLILYALRLEITYQTLPVGLPNRSAGR